jgi:hypothetical protein
MKGKSKKQICKEAGGLVSSYEKISLNTFYQKAYYDKEYKRYRYTGKAHNYTLGE